MKGHRRKAKSLQLEDLLRHGGLSRKQKQKSKFHEQAVEYHLRLSKPLSLSEQDNVEETGTDLPVTAYQVLISWQTLHSPTAAQRKGFEEKAAMGNKNCRELCPLGRSSGSTHFKIQQAGASVLWQRDRDLLLSDKVRAIGLAED